MPLIVTLDRGAARLHVGDFRAVELEGEELRVHHGCAVVAKHRHNRWLASPEGSAEPFMTLTIRGPLVVALQDGHGQRMGPYLSLEMTDGIVRADTRVFGLWDGEHRDWYVKDARAHCARLHIAFSTTPRSEGP